VPVQFSFCKNTEEAGDFPVKQNKLDSERQISHDFSYMGKSKKNYMKIRDYMDKILRRQNK
jgi:hypothetical protein